MVIKEALRVGADWGVELARNESALQNSCKVRWKERGNASLSAIAPAAHTKVRWKERGNASLSAIAPAAHTLTSRAPRPASSPQQLRVFRWQNAGTVPICPQSVRRKVSINCTLQPPVLCTHLLDRKEKGVRVAVEAHSPQCLPGTTRVTFAPQATAATEDADHDGCVNVLLQIFLKRIAPAYREREKYTPRPQRIASIMLSALEYTRPSVRPHSSFTTVAKRRSARSERAHAARVEPRSRCPRDSAASASSLDIAITVGYTNCMSWRCRRAASACLTEEAEHCTLRGRRL
jgi:hypothetical protein